ncbi:hypothetical protein AURDEDRAFT_180692 [Auricularia subglabra TFB-10046 SS5]|nr:hypothetical protein AURDEDRAFT_180692 [Auricularia subglabra TFB-10046 SS5]
MSRLVPVRHLSMSIHEASLVPTCWHSSALLKLVNTPINRHFVEQIVVKLFDVAALALIDCELECSFDALASLADFVVRVVQTCRLSTGTVLGAMVYLERVKPNLRILSCKFAAHRIFMASALIASKYLNDANMSNGDWASCSPFPVRELLLMELEFLHILDYRLAISDADLLALYPTLCCHRPLSISSLPQRALARRASGSAPSLLYTSPRRVSAPEYSGTPQFWSSPPSSLASPTESTSSPLLSPCSDAIPVLRPSSSSSEHSEAVVATPRDGSTFETAVVVGMDDDDDEPDFAFIYSTYSPDSDESFESGFPVDYAVDILSSPRVHLARPPAPLGFSRTPVSRSFPTSALRSENEPAVVQVTPRRESCDVWWRQATHHRSSSGLADITNAAATSCTRDELMEVDITSLASNRQPTPAIEAKGVKRKERRGLVATPPPTRRARIAFQ